MPSEQIQSNTGSKTDEAANYDCDKFVANAAVYGDCFQWHVDADPWTFDEASEWAQQHGIYFNGVRQPPLLFAFLNALLH